MRRPIFIAASLLFVVATAYAQQASTASSVTIFVSDLALSDLRSVGERSNAGYGVALEHMFTERISGQLSVSRKTYQRRVITFVGVVPVTSFPEFALYPVDADVSYHFGSSSHWKPYAGVGLRYEQISVDLSSPLRADVVTSRAVAPELIGGLTYQFRPELGIRLDARQVVRSERSYITKPVFYGLDQPSFVPAFQASLGLSFRY
jgi:outer membrane protein W